MFEQRVNLMSAEFPHKRKNYNFQRSHSHKEPQNFSENQQWNS